MRLLITRPQPGANATASRVVEAGFDAMVMPLFVIKAVPWTLPDPTSYDAVMFTSANAVRSARDALVQLSNLPFYAVGQATARALQIFKIPAFTGCAGVAELMSDAARAGHRNVLWLAGEDRVAVDIPPGLHLHPITVYRSDPLGAPAEFATQVASCDAVLLHSPRAARYFSVLCEEHDLDKGNVTLAALSVAIAESAGPGWREIITAPTPNDAALLSRLQSRFTSASRDP
ncbi:MAG: uroporphyrinogen-III synthase [Sphingorhabdus sp.]